MFPLVQILDVGGPLQVFASANDFILECGGRLPYELKVVAQGGAQVMASAAGLRLSTLPLPLAREPVDMLMVAGGHGVEAAAADPAIIDWVQTRALKARRVASVCTGTFLLAASGLLDGRRAATHWSYCDELAHRFPKVRVESDPIFLRDGAVWSSAGVTAGIDLGLALVEDQWINRHLADDLAIPVLAYRAGMSERSFIRPYTESTGLTPACAIERLRVEAARRLLSESSLPIKRICQHRGFGSEETMRRSFFRLLAVTPQDYRARFSS